MSARIIDGKQVAAEVRAEVASRAEALRDRGIVPGIAVVLVGEDPASQVYVRSKAKAAREAGVEAFDHHLPATTTQAALMSLVGALNADPRVHGILVQLPLPRQIDAQAVLDAIDPDKDVDGFHPVNVGRLWSGAKGFVPCTPLGAVRLAESVGTRLSGANAVVLGRSNIVGKPMAALLLAANATVTVCHSRTPPDELIARCRAADVLVAAIGKPEFVRGDWVKPGATVIDVGINRLPPAPGSEKGRLVGDVNFAEAVERAGAITPVPGGVGPMTIAMLLANTVTSAERRIV